MTDKTREALDAAKKAHDESFDGISHDCFHKGYQAATSAADAKYLPVIEKLVGAADRASGWMYCEIKVKVDSNENNYNPFVQLREALALAAPLLKKKEEV